MAAVSSSSSTATQTYSFEQVEHTPNLLTSAFFSAIALPSTLMEFKAVRDSMNLRGTLAKSCPAANLIAKEARIIPGYVTHVVANSDIGRQLLEPHRNDPNGIFGAVDPNKKGSITKMLEMFLPDVTIQKSDFIMACSPEQTKKYRALILKVLTKQSIRDVIAPQVTTLVTHTVDGWAESKGPVNISSEMRIFTSTVILKILLGCDAPEKFYREVSDTVNQINDLFIRSTYFLSYDQEELAAAQQLLGKTIDNILETSNAPFVKELKDESAGFSRTQMRIMILTLFIAGQETSTTALTQFFLDLADFPEKQNEMNTDEAVKEAMMKSVQMRPPAYCVTRMARVPLMIHERNDDTLTRSYGPIAAGDLVTLVFSPDNLLGTQGDCKGNIPFGHGKHQCPGRELFFEEARQLFQATCKRFEIKNPPNQTRERKYMFMDHFTTDVDILLEKKKS